MLNLSSELEEVYRWHCAYVTWLEGFDVTNPVMLFAPVQTAIPMKYWTFELYKR